MSVVAELDAMLIKMGVSDPDTRAEQVPLLLEQIDTDGDRRISLEEFAVVAEGSILGSQVLNHMIRNHASPL